ncbi:Adaptin N terminal region family protein [Theileria parva strain Muguga]|uniref:Coatomer subunit gamma n=1 Tax=Theileria parva TaxID=5875 RepID=Q4N2P9_THEPA|nr:coatomer subunit gamma [Theileria parva strain Muguga]EAN31649.1 Adaptin N terminal region family protein [Theileria parva strain Muguga]|eukprot:XP_763932.1 coatomer subunit gamma [Theileria parva strain Muguga]
MIRDLKSRLEGSKPAFVNDKNSIFQDVRIFSKVPINSKKCAKVLTKILSMLSCGNEKLSETESTEIFFGVTRLFEADDERLRRLIYLLIKLLPVNETEIFIVTSSLTKDMNSQNYVYRANAIRSICYIMKGAVSPQIERYLKSSLVDKQPYVSSSTLLCSIGMSLRNSEMLKRWFSEITTCLSNKSEMVRFHATILLFILRYNDKQSIRKLVSMLEDDGEHVICFIIRFTVYNSSFVEAKPLLLKYLSHTSPLVKLEAVKGSIYLFSTTFVPKGGNVTNGTKQSNGSDDRAKVRFDNSANDYNEHNDIINRVLEVLLHFLTIGDVYTFASMRQISKLAQLMPEKIHSANKQLESFITCGNRTLCSLALLTLLQTGSSDTVESLLAQASTLSGDFKLEVTRAIKRLCISHPDKFRHVLKFLAVNFRQETAYAPKAEMVDATIQIVSEIPKARTMGISNLCEFIEDCEYPEINCRIIKFLGENIPNTSNPTEYIRFIYNRLMLENPLVRSASIDALENIAKALPELRTCILFIIQSTNSLYNFQLHSDINMSHYYISTLENGTGSVDYLAKLDDFSNKLNGQRNGASATTHEYKVDKEDVSELMEIYNGLGEEKVNLSKLLNKLNDRINDVDGAEPLDSVDSYVIERLSSGSSTDRTSDSFSDVQMDVPVKTKVGLPADIIELVGSELTPTVDIRLTEEEEDYNVMARLFVNLNHLVIEFNVENTLNNQSLENVSIALNTNDCHNSSSYTIVHSSTIEQLSSNESEVLYIVLKNNSPGNEYNSVLMGNVQVNLKYKVICPTEIYEDSLNINNLHLNFSSYVCKWSLTEEEFSSLWENLEEHEEVGTYNLQFKRLQDSVDEVVKYLGMSVAMEKNVNKITWINLGGKFLGEYEVLARASFAQPNQSTCMLKLQVRSDNRVVSRLLLSQLE